MLVEICRDIEAAFGSLLIHGGQGKIIPLMCNLNVDVKDNVKDINK